LEAKDKAQSAGSACAKRSHPFAGGASRAGKRKGERERERERERKRGKDLFPPPRREEKNGGEERKDGYYLLGEIAASANGTREHSGY